jgi:hypothetical protein
MSEKTAQELEESLKNLVLLTALVLVLVIVSSMRDQM